jgi:hypothetical protein
MARSSNGAGQLMAEQPVFAAVVAAVEQVKGRKWAEFRDEYGNTGRDLALDFAEKTRMKQVFELLNCEM